MEIKGRSAESYLPEWVANLTVSGWEVDFAGDLGVPSQVVTDTIFQ